MKTIRFLPRSRDGLTTVHTVQPTVAQPLAPWHFWPMTAIRRPRSSSIGTPATCALVAAMAASLPCPAAFAADLPLKAAPSAFDWSGAYVGAHVGYGFGSSHANVFDGTAYETSNHFGGVRTGRSHAREEDRE